MGNRRSFAIKCESLDAALRQVNRMCLEPGHTGRRAGKPPGLIETVPVSADRWVLMRFEGRVAMLDLCPLHHTLEQEFGFSIRQELIDKTDKGLVDIMLGNSGSNSVDVGACHDSPVDCNLL